MKKIYIISAAAVIALAGIITGILVTTGPDSESVVSQAVDKATEEMTVVASGQDDSGAEEKAAARQDNPVRKTISEPKIVSADRNLNDLSFEEMQAMYPGYLEWFKAKQAQAPDAGLSLPDFTKEELEAMYPGYLEFVWASQVKNRVPDLNNLTFEEMMAMYPGYLEFIKASR